MRVARFFWLLSLVLLAVCSCSRVNNFAESSNFRVEVRYTLFPEDHIDVIATARDNQSVDRRILSVQRDDDASIAILADSILVVTNIRTRGDGIVACLTNLMNEHTGTLFVEVGRSLMSGDVDGISSIENNLKYASVGRKKSRSDVMFVTTHSAADTHLRVIVLLGARSVDLVSITDSTLTFDCMWQRQSSRQRFEVDLSEGLLRPDDFRIVGEEEKR
ncbi:MAG: hypothetical protein RBT76_15045 [candidate division Zixibacteria bacterium]|jgi:hypothetical protein|nr:hypothetical protein [candidate division Zixibacteria bacterium]